MYGTVVTGAEGKGQLFGFREMSPDLIGAGGCYILTELPFGF